MFAAMERPMMKQMKPGLLKAAVASLALCTLASCAHDATSEFGYDSLDVLNNRMSLVDLGYAAAAQGDHATAIQHFRSAHAKNLAYAFARHEPLVGLGESLLAIGQNSAAAKVFVKAANSGGGARAYRGLSKAQLYLNQTGLAVETARRAVQIDPEDPESRSVLGVAMDVHGDHQGAISIYADAITRFPGSMSILSNYGLSMIMAGDMEEGTRMLEDVVRDPRATARDRQNLALAYALGGDFDRGGALAAIDLDVDGVRANLLYADMLRALSPRARFASLISSTRAPKTDYSQNANAVYLRGDNAAWVEETVRRLVPVSMPEEAVTDVPPLMDPTGWAVQIAAYRKLEHLAPGWSYLSTKYADIIGDLEPRRSEVNHPPAAKGPVGFFYRLNAGPLRSKAEADDICRQLEARGGECWVRPPTQGEGRLPEADRIAQMAAEVAMLKSNDYNAVVNQFARSIVEGADEEAGPQGPGENPAKMADAGLLPADEAAFEDTPMADDIAAVDDTTTAPENAESVYTLAPEASAGEMATLQDAFEPQTMPNGAAARSAEDAYQAAARESETLNALSQVFDAVAEAEAGETPPSPGKIMPAMTRSGANGQRSTLANQPLGSDTPTLDTPQPGISYNEDVNSGVF